MNSAIRLAGGLVFAFMAYAQPRIFYSDLDGGPRGGGENGLGAYVSIYGAGFGATRGTSAVTVGGGAVANYPVWSDGKVTFQLGPAAQSGEIRITTAAGASNGVPFAIRGGSIYFVSPTGSDAASGAFGTPWRTVQKAVDSIAPGDIIYLMNGVTAVRSGTSDGSVTLSRNFGAAGSPKALVAYPGAVASIGQPAAGPCFSTACVEGLRTTFTSDYWTIAGLRLAGNSYALAVRGRGWRVVGNDMTCPFGSGASACLDASQSTGVKVFGNDVHDAGYSGSSDLYHGIYFSTDSTDIEIGWNTIRNIQGCRGIQFNSTALDGSTGFNQHTLSVHDNLIRGTQCDGIVFSTVDPSQGPITVYNNVFVDTGRGPATLEGGGTFSCVYAAGYRGSRSGPGSGTIDVLHNTMVNCGGFRTDNGYGGILYARRDTSIEVRVRNNIIVQTNGAPYWVNFDGGDAGLTGSNNLVFGNGAPGGAGPFGTIVADPLFLNAAGGDYRIATNSPARAAGLNTGLATDKDGFGRGAAPDIGAYQAVAGSTGGPVGGGTAVLSVSTTAIDVSVAQGSTPPAQSFTVANLGAGTLDYNITSNQSWLQVVPASGLLSGGGSRAIAVGINAAVLPFGTSTGTLRITGAGTLREITVRVTVNPLVGGLVLLSASPSTFDFAVANGQDEPPLPQTFVLRNVGTAGPVSTWRTRTNASWLSLSPNSGFFDHNGQVVRIDVNPAGLTGGSYVADVDLLADAATNSPVRLTVRLTVGAVGGVTSVLSATPASLEVTTPAGSNPEPRTIAITNNGSAAVDAGVTTDQPWLQAVTSGGFGFLRGGATQTVSVTFDAARLSAGTYTGLVRVGSGSAVRDIPVRLTVGAVVAAPPGLSASASGIDFIVVDASGEPPAPQTVRLRHGGGTVGWTARTDQAWLSLSPNAGLVNDSGQDLRFVVNPAGLAPGAYVTTVFVDSPGALNSPLRLTARLNVGGVGSGALNVSPLAVESSGEPAVDAAAQTVFLSNTGAATAFSAAAEPSWLRVSPATGFLNSGSGQALTISFASAGLAPGNYAGVVRVSGGGVQREVAVRLTVAAGGSSRLAVSNTSFNFAVLDAGEAPPAQTFRLRSGGTGSVAWSARANQPWVSLSPDSGLAPPAGQDVSLQVNPAGLPPGDYTAIVVLTGGSGPGTPLTVRLSIAGASDGGALVVSPGVLEVSAASGVNPPPQTILMRNTGVLSLNYTATSDRSWIQVSPATGTLPAGTGQGLIVTLNTASLGSGVYTGVIRVQGGGVQREIVVRATLGGGSGASAAGLSVNTDTLQFTHREGAEEPPAPQVIRLGNSTGAILNWTSRTDASWVALTPNAGAVTPAGENVSVVVNPSGLPAGTHTATVTLQVAGSTSVIRLTVRLVVSGVVL